MHGLLRCVRIDFKPFGGAVASGVFIGSKNVCNDLTRLAGDKKINSGIDDTWNLHRVTQICLKYMRTSRGGQ